MVLPVLFTHISSIPYNMSTHYHATWFANELSKRNSSDSLKKLGASMMTATVDLNPHQLDAALFAFRSPLSRGAMLADEVGLGKTIEAGLIICQLWAERKRKILVVAPPTLRKQWEQELLDKFHINSLVLDSREFRARQHGGTNPLLPQDRVVICSYNFVQSKADHFSQVPWDLVVMDEAHRMRNVVKPSNKIANAVRDALRGRSKLLLTATPLQNSLTELYGLVSFIDEHLFGDFDTFRERFIRSDTVSLDELRSRINHICQRTLRRQVNEYVKFTQRIAFTQNFTPTPDEQRLYDNVSEYLQRDSLQALPSGQRTLITMVMRKLLASSSFAIAGTLQRLVDRIATPPNQSSEQNDPTTFFDDFEAIETLAEEFQEEQSNSESSAESSTNPLERLSPEARLELAELQHFLTLANSIATNAKGEALLVALREGFQKLQELGARRKAVIFTESRRTQEYLLELLNANGYNGVMTMNGNNTDDRSGAIYRSWAARHAGESVVTGNKAVDLRAALVEHFRDHAEILIATEAAAEGVNLQFASLVVNYDLPWNPQRIEQRIGRCHRYGQQFDVVVINFLNTSNAADQRVFELLSEKFQLFDGVFGASDEVLGALESGVDFERRIADIYQQCRSRDQIDSAFQQLQTELDEQIQERMAETRSKLMEHFDDEVHQRFKNIQQEQQFLNELERALWNLTRFQLRDVATFNDDDFSFTIHTTNGNWPDHWPTLQLATYQLLRQGAVLEGRLPYRMGDDLTTALINDAVEYPLTTAAHVQFNYSEHGAKIGVLEPLIGKSGWMQVQRLTVASLDQEDHILRAIACDDGQPLHPDCCDKLFLVHGTVIQVPKAQLPETSPATNSLIPASIAEQLQTLLADAQQQVLNEVEQRNATFYEDESQKLERWAEDRKQGLELALRDLDIKIKEAKNQKRRVGTLAEKLEVERIIKTLEGERARQRRRIFEAQDEIEAQRDQFIDQVAARLQQSIHCKELMLVRWSVV